MNEFIRVLGEQSVEVGLWKLILSTGLFVLISVMGLNLKDKSFFTGLLIGSAIGLTIISAFLLIAGFLNS